MALTRARKAVYIGTCAAPRNGTGPHLPSRFLDEILLEPTQSVMGALQRLAAGDQRARHELISGVRRHGGIRKIAKNLVVEYMRDLGDQRLARRILRVVAGKRPAPFAYCHAYAPATVPGAEKRRAASVLHQSWAKVAH